MRPMPLALALSLCLLAATSVARAQPFSEVLVNAAIGAYNGNLHMHRVFGTCATYFPSRADVFLFADYFWQVDNLPFSLVGNVVLRDAPESARQGAALAREKQIRELDETFARLGDAGRARACQSFLDANESFKTIAPDAAKVLSPLFESSPELRIEKRNADFTVGCMKRVFQIGGRVFEKARAVCECQTKAITDHASNAELDQWVDDLTRNRGNEFATLSRPWMERASRALSACTVEKP